MGSAYYFRFLQLLDLLPISGFTQKKLAIILIMNWSCSEQNTYHTIEKTKAIWSLRSHCPSRNKTVNECLQIRDYEV